MQLTIVPGFRLTEEGTLLYLQARIMCNLVENFNRAAPFICCHHLFRMQGYEVFGRSIEIYRDCWQAFRKLYTLHSQWSGGEGCVSSGWWTEYQSSRFAISWKMSCIKCYSNEFIFCKRDILNHTPNFTLKKLWGARRRHILQDILSLNSFCRIITFVTDPAICLVKILMVEDSVRIMLINVKQRH